MNQKDMGDLLKQVSKMRKDMDRVQDELRERYVEASVAGDLVEVTFNGQQELVKISIDQKVVTPGADGKVDTDMLEDLVTAAVNAGLEKSKKLRDDEMNDASGGMASGLIPGLF